MSTEYNRKGKKETTVASDPFQKKNKKKKGSRKHHASYISYIHKRERQEKTPIWAVVASLQAASRHASDPGKKKGSVKQTDKQRRFRSSNTITRDYRKGIKERIKKT